MCIANCTNVGGYSLFTSSGLFIVPCGVQQVRALAVGGGSGGNNAELGGGASGYVRSGIFNVTPLSWIQVTVGTGGAGAPYRVWGQTTGDTQPGGNSSFGSYLFAAGGQAISTNNPNGASGGSGGGKGLGCLSGLASIGGTAGNGGTNGSNGLISSPLGCTDRFAGSGQGSFVPYLQMFTRNVFTPGSGGKGGTYSGPASGISGIYPGGGGGGGVMLNGTGPTGQAGTSPTPSANSLGGSGYGGGGGAGGLYNLVESSILFEGGRGVDGLVYIEW